VCQRTSSLFLPLVPHHHLLLLLLLLLLSLSPKPSQASTLSQWNDTLHAPVCEGKEIPYLVPGFQEFFSSITGVVITAMGVIGLLQPRIEVILKLMYAGVVVSGAGTFLLHKERIVAYNLADIFPLLVTLTFGLVAFFDLVTEKRRSDDRMPIELMQQDKDDRWKAVLDLFFYSLCICYLVVGLILMVFPPSLDIFSLYFGPPLVFVGIGGMIYLYVLHRMREGKGSLGTGQRSQDLLILMVAAIFSAALAGLGMMADRFLCGPIVVWFLPHAVFHVATTFSTHCIIVFLGFYRSERLNGQNLKNTSVSWFLHVYPLLVISSSGSIESIPSSTAGIV